MATDDHGAGARLRAELLEYRQAVGGGGYPVGLRDRACRCARTMRRRGLDVTEIAAELGVTHATASIWSRSLADSKGDADVSFVPLVVEGQDQGSRGSSKLEISFPTGAVLRVENTDGDMVAVAITALARGQS